MKFIIHHKYFLILGVLLIINSCASRKDMVYLQDIDSKNSQESTLNYELKLHPDDMLSIIVSAENPEVTNPFNLPQIQSNYNIGKDQSGIKTYLIDKEGFINFPVLGKVHLAEMSCLQANKKIVDLISTYIKNPIVNIKILNYKISILGEVNDPGSFSFNSERVTILEALAMAGDLSIFGKRENILIIREADGKKSYNRIDLTNSSFMESPYYYLSQNDLIIVEPNKTKMNSSKFGPNISIAFSIASLLITLGILIFKK